MSNDPTVQQLRVFQAVAEELHFGRAARRLHTTQPPLTRHVQALERAIGVTLLERSSRRVDLTPAGAALYAEIVVVLARLDRAVELARQRATGQVGRLVLGYVEPLAIDLLPRVLRAFRQLHADIDLRLHELHTQEQIDALHAGTIDCGLLRAPANADPALSFEQVWTDVLMAALPANHRLVRAGRAEIDLIELSEEPFVLYERALGQGLINATLSGCAAAGFTPMVAHQAQSTPMLLTLVAAGEGVALVSGEIARVPRPGVGFLQLRGRPARSDVLLGWRRGEISRTRDDLQHLVRTVPRTDDTHQGNDRQINGIEQASTLD
ncbi:LysR family transcriptional regulator [Streptomyces antnestii]|uniref:LysR family transcriptional regulator n=1 Tax=Streptomyces antnestii TaxID=2494256 RepID=A0A437Q3I2_9ACTN|nr:LysR family transcriptional regulator [Streptomyces sp. San01]RVU29050.1 LysR family transcriptional regulator [Streptomyces sp. San01]